MKIEEVRKKRRKRGSFLGALGFFLFFLILIVVGVIAMAYTHRDRLLVEYIREQGPRKFGFEVLAINSLLTRPIGQVSVELEGLIFQPSPQAPVVRADKIIVSTPNNFLQLYQLYLTGGALKLTTQFTGLHVQAFKSPETSKENAASTAPPAPLALQGLPLALEIDTDIRDSKIEVGTALKPLILKNITGTMKTKVGNAASGTQLEIQNSGQLALVLPFASASGLPVRTDWTLSTSPKLSDPTNLSLNVTNLAISTLGITLKSHGQLKWPEQLVSLEAQGTTADLGTLPLDTAESEALGLSGRLKGQAEVSIKLSGDLDGTLDAEGLLRIKEAQFPFALSKQTPRPFEVRGPVDIDIDAPFKISYDRANAKLKSLDLTHTTFKVDMTAAAVNAQNLIRKPSGHMLSLAGQISAAGDTIELGDVEFRLANLRFSTKGQASLDPKRLSKLDASLTLPSLAGWPSLLPVLGTLERDAKTTFEEMNRAKGSFAVKAKAELPLGALETLQTNSKFDVELFEASDLEFPINLKNTEKKTSVQGVLRANLSGAGQVTLTGEKDAPYTWILKRAVGAFDLKDVAIAWSDLFKKPANKNLSGQFAIASIPSTTKDLRLQVDRFDFRLLDSNFATKGFVVQHQNGDLKLGSTLSAQASLVQIYDALPSLRSLRAKFPAGSLFANLKLDGTFLKKGGIETSPLTANGRIALKIPKALLLDTTTASKEVAKTKETSEADKNSSSEKDPLKWPIVANSSLVFDIQIDSVAMKASEIKSLKALATLDKGNLNGHASLGSVFGGSAQISKFSVNEISKLQRNELTLNSSLAFASIGLSPMADFFDPQWKSLVGGRSTGALSFSVKPLSETSLIDTLTAAGKIAVKQGHFSTVSFDQLLNKKLAEIPIVAKLMGSEPKIATKGVSLALNSDFALAKGRLNLKNLQALSPEKNEMRVAGWMQTDMRVDLQGEIFLADTPIGGSFRQANSDKMGRLVVPVHITGTLKEPGLAIAEATVREMTQKTVDLEARKLKTTIQEKAGQAIKEELKKRGLSF